MRLMAEELPCGSISSIRPQPGLNARAHAGTCHAAPTTPRSDMSRHTRPGHATACILTVLAACKKRQRTSIHRKLKGCTTRMESLSLSMLRRPRQAQVDARSPWSRFPGRWRFLVAAGDSVAKAFVHAYKRHVRHYYSSAPIDTRSYSQLGLDPKISANKFSSLGLTQHNHVVTNSYHADSIHTIMKPNWHSGRHGLASTVSPALR